MGKSYFFRILTFCNYFIRLDFFIVVSLMSGESGMPGVFFSYELAPVMVKYTEKQKSFGHFATGLCAIIGGVFTVAGLIDKIFYTSSRLLEEKLQLGKST